MSSFEPGNGDTIRRCTQLGLEAAKKYFATGSPYWWDRWLKAVLSVSKFLGLDAPTKLNAKLDSGDISFTIEFERPDALHEGEPQMASNGSQTGDR